MARRSSLLFPLLRKKAHQCFKRQYINARVITREINVSTCTREAVKCAPRWGCELGLDEFDSTLVVHIRGHTIDQKGATPRDHNPTNVQHVYVSRPTLTLQFMRALAALSQIKNLLFPLDSLHPLHNREFANVVQCEILLTAKSLSYFTQKIFRLPLWFKTEKEEFSNW